MANHVVSMTDNKYSDPAGSSNSTTVAHVGDTIQWRNDGNATHNAESSNGPHFNTGDIAPGATSTPITLAQASTDPAGFLYTCSQHHPNMTGHIIVALPGSNLKAIRDALGKKAGN